jgi:hypothetical protein
MVTNGEAAQADREMQFGPVRDAYSYVMQAAGLPAPKFDGAYDSPEQYRCSLLHQLQETLPAGGRMLAPVEVLREYREMFPLKFNALETAVMQKAIDVAHQSPTLRPVLTVDHSGRQIVEFFGGRGNWMNQFRQQPRQMLALGGVPFGDS